MDGQAERQEPAFMGPLRCIGGIVGLLKAHAEMLEKDQTKIPPAATMRRTAERLNGYYLELWKILVEDAI